MRNTSDFTIQDPVQSQHALGGHVHRRPLPFTHTQTHCERGNTDVIYGTFVVGRTLVFQKYGRQRDSPRFTHKYTDSHKNSHMWYIYNVHTQTHACVVHNMCMFL